jgi:hypothetical protein
VLSALKRVSVAGVAAFSTPLLPASEGDGAKLSGALAGVSGGWSRGPGAARQPMNNEASADTRAIVQ